MTAYPIVNGILCVFKEKLSKGQEVVLDLYLLSAFRGNHWFLVKRSIFSETESMYIKRILNETDVWVGEAMLLYTICITYHTFTQCSCWTVIVVNNLVQFHIIMVKEKLVFPSSWIKDVSFVLWIVNHVTRSMYCKLIRCLADISVLESEFFQWKQSRYSSHL